MNIVLTFLFCLLTSVTTFAAQDPSNALLLQSGKIYPEENLESFMHEVITSKDIIDGYYYRIIQFQVFPDDKLKKDIASAGIILNTYLPYRSFICAIPSNFDRNKLQQLQVRSVINWTQQMKLNNSINGQDFPKHTRIEEGHADVVVFYQENIAHQRALDMFLFSGFRVISSRSEIKTVTVRLPVEKLNKLTSLPFVYYIEPISKPSTKDDAEGKSLHRSNLSNASYAAGMHYDGMGVTIGLADDGIVGPHIDFAGRITQHLSTNDGNHGDMTSGICVGAGNLQDAIKGMATGSDIHIFSIDNYPQVDSAVFNYNNYGIVIASTSYAQTCNTYNADAQLGDMLIYQNGPFSFCFSSGNEGTTDCNYGAGSTWGNITGGYKMGKNVVAVGNLNNLDLLETSSSRGPASDGRIKPDICSNGAGQESTDENNTYQVGSGTSAACPGVAGCLAQLYQAYKEKTGEPQPHSGLMKACILNTAEDLGNVGPDFKHGWGRINAYRAIKTIEDVRYFIDSISQGQTRTHDIQVPANVRQLKVMLCWNDKEGSPAAQKALVNDLNMQVEESSSGDDYDPWVLDPTPNGTALNALPVRKIDSLNIAEQVTIDDPSAGTFEVHVEGFQVPFGPQKFFIVYMFETDSIMVTYPAGGEGFASSVAEIVRWDAYGINGNFDVHYSPDNGTTWNVIGTNVSGSVRHRNWNIPAIQSDRMLVRVTRNGISDVTDTNFTVIGQPGNLRVTFSCPDSVGLAWNAVAGASGYEVSMLGTKYMDFVGTTNATNFTITGTVPTNEYWFSVKALGANGGRGRRANAIRLGPSTFDCGLNIDGAVVRNISISNGAINNCQNLGNFPVTLQLRNEGITPLSNFDLSYSLNGGTAVMEQYSGTLAPGDSTIFTFAQTLNIATNGNYSIKSWTAVSGDQNSYNDTSLVSFAVISGTTAPLAVVQNFESNNLCSTTSNCGLTNCNLGGGGWVNVSNGLYDDIDWRVGDGPTVSTNTGPDVDHTLGTAVGKYVFLEASACANSEAILLSPCFDLSGITTPLLTFWYHMFGADMGDLHVDVIHQNGITNDVIPVKSGNRGNVWLKDSVDLAPYVGQTISIRFRGVTGDEFLSDMALDDINVVDRITSIDETGSEMLFTIYPNPAKGVFNFANAANGPFDITIRDITGKEVYSRSYPSHINTGTIDLSDFADGIYTASIQSEKVSRQVKLMKAGE